MKNKSVEIRILKSLLRGERNGDGQGGHGCHLGGIRPGMAGQAMDREGGRGGGTEHRGRVLEMEPRGVKREGIRAGDTRSYYIIA